MGWAHEGTIGDLRCSDPHIALLTPAPSAMKQTSALAISPALVLGQLCGAEGETSRPRTLAAAAGLRRGDDWNPARGFGALLLVCAVGLWLAYLGSQRPHLYDY